MEWYICYMIIQNFVIPSLVEDLGCFSKEKNASTRQQNKESIELEVEAAIWPPWAPRASESTG